MFHTQKQQRGRGHNSFFSCTQEKNAYKKSERNRRVRRKESANPKPSQCTPFWDRRRERQWIPVHWKWSTPSLLLYRGCFVVRCVSSSSSTTNPMQHSDLRERAREIERSSVAPRWNTVVATTLLPREHPIVQYTESADEGKMKPDPPSSRLADTTAKAWTSRGNLSSMPEHWLATVLLGLLAERRLLPRASRT